MDTASQRSVSIRPNYGLTTVTLRAYERGVRKRNGPACAKKHLKGAKRAGGKPSSHKSILIHIHMF